MNYVPVPEQKDYEAAIDIMDEELRRAGGAWFIAHNMEMNAHDKRSLFHAV